MTDELKNLFGLHGKTALITGANMGIGREIARIFVLAGARVVIAARNAERNQLAADELRKIAASPDDVLAIETDICAEDSVLNLYAQIDQRFGAIDVLVNNAGNPAKYPLLDTTVEQWDQSQHINLRGPFLCLREAVRRMQAGGRGGAIVNVSSLSGMSTTVFNNAPYGSAKAGLNMLTKNAAIEFASAGIRVNAVLPGAVMTEGGKQISVKFKPAGPMLNPGRQPMGRFATPTEVATTVLFLASPAASYVTGQLLVVDGGYQVS